MVRLVKGNIGLNPEVGLGNRQWCLVNSGAISYSFLDEQLTLESGYQAVAVKNPTGEGMTEPMGQFGDYYRGEKGPTLGMVSKLYGTLTWSFLPGISGVNKEVRGQLIALSRLPGVFSYKPEKDYGDSGIGFVGFVQHFYDACGGKDEAAKVATFNEHFPRLVEMVADAIGVHYRVGLVSNRTAALNAQSNLLVLIARDLDFLSGSSVSSVNHVDFNQLREDASEQLEIIKEISQGAGGYNAAEINIRDSEFVPNAEKALRQGETYRNIIRFTERTISALQKLTRRHPAGRTAVALAAFQALKAEAVDVLDQFARKESAEADAKSKMRTAFAGLNLKQNSGRNISLTGGLIDARRKLSPKGPLFQYHHVFSGAGNMLNIASKGRGGQLALNYAWLFKDESIFSAQLRSAWLENGVYTLYSQNNPKLPKTNGMVDREDRFDWNGQILSFDTHLEYQRQNSWLSALYLTALYAQEQSGDFEKKGKVYKSKDIFVGGTFNLGLPISLGVMYGKTEPKGQSRFSVGGNVLIQAGPVSIYPSFDYMSANIDTFSLYDDSGFDAPMGPRSGVDISNQETVDIDQKRLSLFARLVYEPRLWNRNFSFYVMAGAMKVDESSEWKPMIYGGVDFAPLLFGDEAGKYKLSD